VERRLSVALAAIGVLAAAASIVLPRHPAPPVDQVGAIAAEMDGLVRETGARVEERADTLAQLPRLAWAVATDEATTRDLTSEELAFRPHPGEHIEVAQIRAGRVQPLLRLPDPDAPPLPMSRLGTHLLVSNGRIQVLTVASIRPAQRMNELAGAVAVVKALDAAAVSKRLSGLGVGARVETTQGSMTLARGPSGPDTTVARVALQSAPAEGAVLVVSSAAAARSPVLSLFMLTLTFAGAGLLWRRGGRAAPQRPELAPSPEEAPRADLAAASGSLPPGLPSRATTRVTPLALMTLGSQARSTPATATAAAESSGDQPSEEGTPTEAPLTWSGSVALPEDLPPPKPSRRASLAGGEGSHQWRKEYAALFQEFVRLRRTCSESVDNLDRELFVESLHDKWIELMKLPGVKDVRFRLAFDNGKAAIRFTAVGSDRNLQG
jgi:hypothetical protein